MRQIVGGGEPPPYGIGPSDAIQRNPCEWVRFRDVWIPPRGFGLHKLVGIGAQNPGRKDLPGLDSKLPLFKKADRQPP